MTKKASKKAPKKAKKAKKVTMSGERHLEKLVGLPTGHFPMQTYDILSAIRGPDFSEVANYAPGVSSLKEKFTGVLRTWIFGDSLGGVIVQSQEAPVTAKGWRTLNVQARMDCNQDTEGENAHFLLHIISACEAIEELYAKGTFKEGK